jgi:hypothetical protein
MTTALERFHRLRANGWKIEEITIGSGGASVKVTDGKHSEVIESDNGQFAFHLFSYRHLPNLSTGRIELTFVEDTEKYHELEKKFFDFTCGLQPYLSIRERTDLPTDFDLKRISTAVETWIESEKALTRVPAGLPRIFYDILVLFSSGGIFDCRILEKEHVIVDQIATKLDSADWAYAFSVAFLCPKPAQDINRDAVMIVALYDLKKKESAACVGTVRSILNHAHRQFTKGHELLEAALDLCRRVMSPASWHFIVVAPFRDSEFTAVPWIAFALLQHVPVEPTEGIPLISIPEMILFGDPDIPRHRSSLDFKTRPQSAALILELKDAARSYICTIHFDRSPGEPDFHMDVEIKFVGSPTSHKLVSHKPMLLRDVWNLSQDLYLAFMTAGAFDVRFDELISKDLRDFNELMKEEPLAVYPLIYRGHIEPKVKWLVSNPNALALLKRIWQNDRYTPAEAEKTLLTALETRELLESGALTNLAVWILSRGQV